jgi:hypothetical protein
MKAKRCIPAFEATSPAIWSATQSAASRFSLQRASIGQQTALKRQSIWRISDKADCGD